MNKEKLLILEDKFLSVYPLGFQSEDMVKIGKKHPVRKVSEYTRQVCSLEHINKGLSAVPEIAKIITKSSMVSVFEKMRFRDTIKGFTEDEQYLFLYSIKELLHGDEEEGFNQLVYLLKPYQLAKWSIITAFKVYNDLQYEVYMKPTTVKKIIRYLELDDMVYTPTPYFKLYNNFRKTINEMKKYVDKRLSPNNPAFTGFLMMAIEE